jgi:hypothetical protein
MGIPNATVVQLQVEGIDTVDDLADVDKDTIEQIAANLRRPAGRIPNPGTLERLQVRRLRRHLLRWERNPKCD